MKIGMLNLTGNVPIDYSSHNAGWTLCLSNIIFEKYGTYPDLLSGKENFDNYDIICINNGVNYKSGIYNFFGGVSKNTLLKLNKLSKFNKKLICFNDEIVFNDLLKRKEITSVPNNTVELHYTHDYENLIIGDSHSISIYRPGYGISKNDGKTLYGFLKNPYKYFDISLVKKIVLYFGNIDVRFHLARLENPENSTIELVNNYLDFIKILVNKNILVEVQGLLPVENESRKIPKSGMYKGEPFYGSMEQREKIRNIFNLNLNKSSKSIGFVYSSPWLNYPLSFNDMEKNQSVHIKPLKYLYFEQIIKNKNNNINNFFN